MSYRWRLFRVSVIAVVLMVWLTAPMTATGQQPVPNSRSLCIDKLHTLHQYDDRSVSQVINGRILTQRWRTIDRYIKAIVRGHITDVVLTKDTIQFTEKDPRCTPRTF